MGEQLTNVTFWIAQVIGALVLFVTVWSMQLDKKKPLMRLQIISEILYIVQYVLLGAFSGALMATINMVRDYVFYKYDKKRAPWPWMLGIIAAMTAATIASWKDWTSLLPYIGSVFYATALWIGNIPLIRVGNVAGNGFYVVYQFIWMAFTGMIATLIEMGSAVLGFFRHDLDDVERAKKRIAKRRAKENKTAVRRKNGKKSTVSGKK